MLRWTGRHLFRTLHSEVFLLYLVYCFGLFWLPICFQEWLRSSPGSANHLKRMKSIEVTIFHTDGSRESLPTLSFTRQPRDSECAEQGRLWLASFRRCCGCRCVGCYFHVRMCSQQIDLRRRTVRHRLTELNWPHTLSLVFFSNTVPLEMDWVGLLVLSISSQYV